MFSPVHCSITVSYLSQMLKKRFCESSFSSIQSPKHLWGTPFSMQHCSKIECTTISSHPTLPLISNKCFYSMIIYSIYLDKSYRGTVLSFLSHLYMGALHRALPSSRIFHLFSSHLHRSQSKLQLSIRSIRNLLKGKCLVDNFCERAC